MAVPSELKSPEGTEGLFGNSLQQLYQKTLSSPLAFIRGKYREAPHLTAMRRHDGIVNAHDLHIETIVRNGTEEMQRLGWIDKNGQVTKEAIGEIDNPGPLRILYNALHDESYLPLVVQNICGQYYL